jgi:hypothetical protein
MNRRQAMIVVWGLWIDPTSDLGPSKAGMPGELLSRGRTTIFALKDGEALTVDVPFTRIVRLREPEDSARGVPWKTQDPPHLASPVRFSWDAIPGARRYVVRVQERVPPRFPVPTLAEATLTTTQWTVDLQPTAVGEQYAFDLHAFGETAEVGELQVEGIQWLGWDYRFVVDPPTVATSSR